MARTTLPALAVLVLCVGVTVARYVIGDPAPRRSLRSGNAVPVGWWHSLKTKNGTFCSLRDFPPRGIYGSSRVYCILNSYDIEWMWRLTKVSGDDVLSSGDKVYLWTHNPVSKYCRSGANVVCGVGINNATMFTVEKVTGTGSLSLTNDDFYLKVGSLYCGLSGKGHSQQLACNVRAADKAKRATVFQAPASSYAYINIVNQLSELPCVGNFLQDYNTPTSVYCGPRTGFAVSDFTVALKTPGAAVLQAGANVAFKYYDRLWTYVMSSWKQKGSEISFVEEDIYGDELFFSLERLTGAATGGVLTNETDIAIRSSIDGKYCGISIANQTAIACDNNGPRAALPLGYRYKYYNFAN